VSLFVAAMLLSLAGFAAAQDANQATDPQPNAEVNQQSTTPAQTPTTPPEQATPPADPSSTPTSSDLPKTASPLPLVGLSGLVSLAAGAWLGRPRRKA
jgi:hypothetical protein